MSEHLAIDGEALDEVSATDRAWFAAHPGRTMYLRHPHWTEIMDGWAPDMTLVIRAQPGLRFRVPYQGANVVHKQYPHSLTEAGCRKIWAGLEKQYPNHPVLRIPQECAAGDGEPAEFEPHVE
jgi:hypothetical protein